MNYSKTLQKHLTDQKSYVSNKKVLSVSQKHYLNLLVYKYGGEGGIRTHGTVTGTLVFKATDILIIPIDLMQLKEQSCPKLARSWKLKKCTNRFKSQSIKQRPQLQ